MSTITVEPACNAPAQSTDTLTVHDGPIVTTKPDLDDARTETIDIGDGKEGTTHSEPNRILYLAVYSLALVVDGTNDLSLG